MTGTSGQTIMFAHIPSQETPRKEILMVVSSSRLLLDPEIQMEVSPGWHRCTKLDVRGIILICKEQGGEDQVDTGIRLEKDDFAFVKPFGVIRYLGTTEEREASHPILPKTNARYRNAMYSKTRPIKAVYQTIHSPHSQNMKKTAY